MFDNYCINIGGVEKVNFLYYTPKSPRGDLLKSSNLKAPLGGFGGKNELFRQPLPLRQSKGKWLTFGTPSCFKASPIC
jgi:hypothetical protein